MNDARSESFDRRSQRTQDLILAAFSELVQTKRYETFRVSDIIRRAGIGRSTFYDHYSSKEDVLLQSMEGLLSILAGAIIGQTPFERLDGLLQHFWERRAVARTIFTEPMLPLIANRLAVKIAQGSDESLARLRGIHAAYGVLAVIESWVFGRIAVSREDLATWIKRDSFERTSNRTDRPQAGSA
jgi:AcrR family transcriptional regulator